MDFQECIKTIKPACEKAKKDAKLHWNNRAKPLHGLGLLEDAIIKIAGITGNHIISLKKRCVAVMCADNGVVAQGISQSDHEVTAIISENFTKGCTSVCLMAKTIGADIFPIDIGIYRDIQNPLLINKKIMYGTNDMTIMPAMSREQAIAAIQVGIDMVFMLKSQGYNIVCTGEMGIGNTTTSSALASLLLNLPVETVTGVGAGLDDVGLQRKIAAIKKAIQINAPDVNDPIDMISKVGGLDIAGMVGLYIGGAVCNIPIVIDGIISSVSALLASKINPLCIDYMLPSHVSKEPAGELLLKKIGLFPIINCNMCLGEGTGAVCAVSLIDMALVVYNEMCSFSDLKIKQYEDKSSKITLQ